VTEVMQMDKFEIGEVVVIVKADTFPEMIGVECTITEPLRLRVSKSDGKQYFGYATDVRCPNGARCCPSPDKIRRKSLPPEDRQLVRWSECPWQPTKVQV
jgi:hypothetical protein